MQKLGLVLIPLFLSISTDRDKVSSYQVLWKDGINSQKRQQVSRWIDIAFRGTSELLGIYPFQTNIYMHVASPASEPVPWANTVRYNEQGIHFHIDTSYSFTAFNLDWTAPHEMSHLALPYLGPDNAWFAEGFATYCQSAIQVNIHTLSPAEAIDKLYSKWNAYRSVYNTDQPFPKQAKMLVKNNDYPSMYWGGCMFFVLLDASIRNNSKFNLFTLVKEYQTNGRLRDQTLEEVILSWDTILKQDIASQFYQSFTTRPGVKSLPEIQGALTKFKTNGWLTK